MARIEKAVLQGAARILDEFGRLQAALERSIELKKQARVQTDPRRCYLPEHTAVGGSLAMRIHWLVPRPECDCGVALDGQKGVLKQGGRVIEVP